MEVPKGKIIAIGGNEDKGTVPAPTEVQAQHQLRFFDYGILKRIHDELHGLGSRIEVVTTASLIPEEIGKVYQEAFLRLGCDNVGVLHIKSIQEANDPQNLHRFSAAHGVMFTGGDQSRITTAFNGSEALKVLKKRYAQEEKFLISGTSAGAMALSQVMIKGSWEQNALVKGMVTLDKGMGLLNEIVVDTHFVNRRRIPRLIEAIASNPLHLGIGLGEDTGILVTENQYIETIGSGLVIVIDGRQLEENNYGGVKEGEALCLEHLVMHVLPKGRRYNMATGEFM
ncbi:cyanophycinase [Rufibacter radiotolerans]|uniref:Cyanophycinase n=1 Tax=Rufibacter radiotolerans TaxID=1379910 RepID=A0A0H4VJP1_9BACT|nr:cyanophycinase [Rufibacter radiotolerans]AKQ45563.1 cyanophycinase [Rufibacter radiotolerans]